MCVRDRVLVDMKVRECVRVCVVMGGEKREREDGTFCVRVLGVCICVGVCVREGGWVCVCVCVRLIIQHERGEPL